MNYTYLSCFHFLRSVTNVYTTGTLLLTLISSVDCYDSKLIIIELNHSFHLFLFIQILTLIN